MGGAESCACHESADDSGRHRVDASGDEVQTSEEYAGQRFASQADAESWVGETWTELADEGVASVTLFEGERAVYGPMSLSA